MGPTPLESEVAEVTNSDQLRVEVIVLRDDVVELSLTMVTAVLVSVSLAWIAGNAML